MEQTYDVTIIGAGPGGYVAAIRAAQLGLKVALVEKEHLGGVCLNWGCIPTKALLRNAEVISLLEQGKEFGFTVTGFAADFGAAVERSRKVAERLVKGVASLMRKNQIEVLEGVGVLRSPNQVVVGERVLATRHVIIATGGRAREVLIPDFRAQVEPLQTVLEARPDVLGHNVESVPRLFRTVQPQCRYEWSLATLRNAKTLWPEAVTKSGLMVGLGETTDEVLATLRDLREIGVDLLTIGQYLQPTRDHHPVARYYTPEEFEMFHARGMEMGFRWVESGPLVRSSYHAEQQGRAVNAS